ncbi:MAG TPA: hypothetical protein VJ962_10545 [Clostridia bacterium]|nr:hypothetical protein [Clostridia bacterium]
MIDYYKKYKWVPIIKIKKKDLQLFQRIFYSHDLPGKVKDYTVYSTEPYRDIIEGIVEAHYNNKLSNEYYRKLRSQKRLIEPVKTSLFRKHFLKIIGPVILLIIILVFIRFLFVFNIL